MTVAHSPVVIRQARPLAAALVGGHLDRPHHGDALEGGRLLLGGWVIGREAPAVAVEVTHQDALVKHAPVGVSRPDLTAAFPDQPRATHAGFRITVPVLPGTVALTLEVVTILAGQRRVPLATVQVPARPPVPTPLVSVVIPCFDQAHFLSEALDSVLSQTYRHLEIVVVDDGSHDNTAAVVGGYPGVRCIRQANGGLAAARNTGIRATTGDYLLFLDADDRLLSEAVQTGLDILDAHPDVALSFGHHRSIDAASRFVSQGSLACTEAQAYQALLTRNVIEMHATVLYRRCVLDRVGYFNESLPAAEDHELLLRIARVHPVRCSHCIVAEYRRHGGNMTRRAGLLLAANARVLRMQRPHLNEYSGDTESLRTAYRSGRRFIRSYYGAPLARQVSADLQRRDWAGALGNALVLARHHPTGLAALLPRRRQPWSHRVAGAEADPRRACAGLLRYLLAFQHLGLEVARHIGEGRSQIVAPKPGLNPLRLSGRRCRRG